MEYKGKKVKKPSPLLLAWEGRTVVELGLFMASYPKLMKTPEGDGHPVMILPGFMADDVTTLPMRKFLTSRGYEALPWGLGRNLGNPEMELPLIRRVKEIKREFNQKVSLIGWSLGGVYAREIARLSPKDVRQVITLGSPFSGIGENNATWVYKLLRGKDVKDLDPELLERMRAPLEVPNSAVFSKSDGVVPWESCINHYEADNAENVETFSSHCGMGHHPAVMMFIANRLSQAEGQWEPFAGNMPLTMAS